MKTFVVLLLVALGIVGVSFQSNHTDTQQNQAIQVLSEQVSNKEVPVLGVVSGCGTFPTSSLNNVQDGDTISSCKWNALERKIGIDLSSDATSLDYMLRNALSINPGHHHTSSSIDGYGLFTNVSTTNNMTVGGYVSVTGALTDSFGTKYSTSSLTSISVQGTTITGPSFTFATSGPLFAISGSGQTITFTSGTQYASSSMTFNIYDATSTSPYKFAKWRTSTAATLAAVSCNEAAAATTTVQIYKATSVATTTNAGDLIASLACGISGTSTTSFAASSLAVDDFIIVNVTSTAGVPTWTAVNVYYKK